MEIIQATPEDLEKIKNSLLGGLQALELLKGIVGKVEQERAPLQPKTEETQSNVLDSSLIVDSKEVDDELLLEKSISEYSPDAVVKEKPRKKDTGDNTPLLLTSPEDDEIEDEDEQTDEDEDVEEEEEIIYTKKPKKKNIKKRSIYSMDDDALDEDDMGSIGNRMCSRVPLKQYKNGLKRKNRFKDNPNLLPNDLAFDKAVRPKNVSNRLALGKRLSAERSKIKVRCKVCANIYKVNPALVPPRDLLDGKDKKSNWTCDGCITSRR